MSIIIPAHNSENTIERCINSIVNQNYKNTQIIVVINESNDETYNKCVNLKKQYDNIVVLFEEKGGVSNARNIGLRYAKGDIIGFCDADDSFSEGIIQTIVREFEQYDMLIVGYNNLNQSGELISAYVIRKSYELSRKDLVAGILLNRTIFGAVWNKFYKRKILENYFFDIDLTMCEDCHYNLSVVTHNENIHSKYCNVIGYNYYNNPSSVTNQVKKIFENENNRYLESMDKIRVDCSLTNEEIKYLNSACLRLAFESFILLKKNAKIEPNLYIGRKIKLKKNIKIYLVDYLFCSQISFEERMKCLAKIILYIH